MLERDEKESPGADVCPKGEEGRTPKLFSEAGSGPPETEVMVAPGAGEEALVEDPGPAMPVFTGRRKGKTYRRPAEPELQPHVEGHALSGEQRLLIDAWRRSELTAREFGKIAGVPAHTLYAWRRPFDPRAEYREGHNDWCAGD